MAAATYRSVFAPALFAGKVAVVTGGGSGIGRCIGHELASLGAHVVLIGRQLETLHATAGEILADGGRASFHACDTGDEEAVKNTVQAIIAVHGRIDALVNNAGAQPTAPLETISLKGWEAELATHLTGGFLMARECYVQSMQVHGGAIVNIAHGGAARSGMLSFTETAAAEWAHSGVRVNAVAPRHFVSSGMDRQSADGAPVPRELGDTVPMRRLGTEAETSAAVSFLLSPAAAFITGSVLRVDGGPQLQMGGLVKAPREDAQQRDAVRPFEGFHRAVVPQVLPAGDEASPGAKG